MDPGQQEHNRAAQAELYGESLGELFRRLMAAFALTQAQLAKAIGVSAPMLSQLISAQRVKIGNPAVIQRINALSELAADVAEGRAGDDDIAHRLEEIRGSSGVLTRTTHHGDDTASGSRAKPAPADVVVAVRGLLRAVASGQELQDVASSIASTHPGLAELLRVYGVGGREEAVEHYVRHEQLF